MLGLIVLIAVYCVLGFLFTWIAQIVAKEEVSVGAGIGIVVGTGIAAAVTAIGLAASVPALVVFIMPLVNFGLLVCLTHLIARLSWKHSAIIAAIYTALMFLVGIAFTACAAATT